MCAWICIHTYNGHISVHSVVQQCCASHVPDALGTVDTKLNKIYSIFNKLTISFER